MNSPKQPVLSFVVPVYNEAAGLEHFHTKLTHTLQKHVTDTFELIYVDDGSGDDSARVLREFAKDVHVRIISLTRNFGKEVALTAGMQYARGQAVISLDADGQHPVVLIPEFISAWKQGATVVVGKREQNSKEGMVKRFGSKLFYRLFNRLTGIKLTAGATDFRLIDASVQREFARMTERNRMTRGLIEWLGHNTTYIPFSAAPRSHGTASYSSKKLFKLAIDSTISMSISPLYLTAYMGAIVLPVSVLLGLGMVVNLLLHDPLSLHATGGAYVLVLVLFLIGILLVSQGIIGLYLSHIHTETQNRPLYVIDEQASIKL